MMSRTTALRGVLLASLGIGGLLALPNTGTALDQPPLNLGFTSFMDGGPPSGPGWYFSQYLQYWSNDKVNDGNGHQIALPVPGAGTVSPNVDAWISLTQLIYQSDQKLLLGGKWGLDVIVPTVYADASPSGMLLPGGEPLTDNTGGVGDLLVGPFLQWDPIMGKNGPIFMHRVEFQMLLPTGKYNSAHEINPGSNFFSFNPYWAGTLFLAPRWTASWRLHYLWNAENHDPWDFYGGASNTQAGQTIHGNFASSYEVLPKKLRVGVNGYYLNQFEDTKRDGVEVPFTQQEVLGLGPGFLWSFSQDDHLFFNTYFESNATWRAEGWRINLRWVHHFKRPQRCCVPCACE